jgi:hypothetical protein
VIQARETFAFARIGEQRSPQIQMVRDGEQLFRRRLGTALCEQRPADPQVHARALCHRSERVRSLLDAIVLKTKLRVQTT